MIVGHVTVGKDKVRYLLFKKGRWREASLAHGLRGAPTPLRINPDAGRPVSDDDRLA